MTEKQTKSGLYWFSGLQLFLVWIQNTCGGEAVFWYIQHLMVYAFLSELFEGCYCRHLTFVSNNINFGQDYTAVSSAFCVIRFYDFLTEIKWRFYTKLQTIFPRIYVINMLDSLLGLWCVCKGFGYLSRLSANYFKPKHPTVTFKTDD